MKNIPKKSPSTKKQSSILQWSNRGKIIIGKEEVIDLTFDDTEIILKDEEETVLVKEQETEDITMDLCGQESKDVNCPICEADITQHDIDSRTKHVEKCLLLLTLKEKKISEIETNSNKRKKKETKTCDRNLVYVNKKPKNSKETEKKEIKAPSNLSVSKRKNQIPRVKILRFPTNPTNTYEIAVDAFCYAPHNSINQYFLTHFHADHYGGITKKWCYERLENIPEDLNDVEFKKIIYCTRITSKLLTLRFSVDPRFIAVLDLDKRYLIKSFGGITPSDIKEGAILCNENGPGLYVTPISANHCPGSAIFLFESISTENKRRYTLHCGDFRVSKEMILHDRLKPFFIENSNCEPLDFVYLDTTYMTPKYNFPKQNNVCEEVSSMLYRFVHPDESDSLASYVFGILKQSRITDFVTKFMKKKKLLILIGTYLIGKENLAISILKKLNCPIYVLNINSRGDKSEIIKSFDDLYLNLKLTDDELGGECECVVHLVPMKIVGTLSELSNYFNHNKYHASFERCIGFRPSGWSFLNPWETDNSDIGINTNALEVDSKLSELHEIMITQPKYSYLDNIIQKVVAGSKSSGTDSSLYKLYAIPYSEHSSFRELCFFSIFLNVKHIIPTVNIDNPNSIAKMESIIRTWKYYRDVKLNKECNLESTLIEKIQSLRINDF